MRLEWLTGRRRRYLVRRSEEKVGLKPLLRKERRFTRLNESPWASRSALLGPLRDHWSGSPRCHMTLFCNAFLYLGKTQTRIPRTQRFSFFFCFCLKLAPCSVSPLKRGCINNWQVRNDGRTGGLRRVIEDIRGWLVGSVLHAPGEVPTVEYQKIEIIRLFNLYQKIKCFLTFNLFFSRGKKITKCILT